MDKFRGKYRISSARLREWNYASEGMYFVTICTKNRKHYFGEIVPSKSDGKNFEMQFSGIGKAVENEWLKTTEVRPDMNLTLGEYQVMPNHFHAILIIGENQYNTKNSICDLCPENPLTPYRDTMPRVSIYKESESESNSNSQSKSEYKVISDPAFELENQMILESNMKDKNKFAPQSKNLGSVMRGFKSSVTMFALDNNIVFHWQPRYYDHIIRNYDDYERICTYIRNNPANWGNDRLR